MSRRCPYFNHRVAETQRFNYMKGKGFMDFKVISMTVLAWVFFGGISGLNAAPENAYLVKDGKAQAEIVISDKPERAVNLAAKELQTYISKITGAQLQIVTKPGDDVPVRIYVGRSAWSDKLGIEVKDLKKDMYKLVSEGKWLALIGNDEEYKPSEPWCKSREDRPRMQAEWEKRTGKTWLSFDLSSFKGYSKELDIWAGDGAGSLYAVDDFLRGLGVEWYMPGELGEIVPKRASIALLKVNKTVKPEIAYRGITFVDFFLPGTADNALWYFRLGLGAPIQGFGHSMQVILSDKNNQEKHPEYYALYNGKREFLARGGKPCLSTEAFFNEMLAYVRAYFDTYPEATAFPVMPTDGFSNMCQCDLCKCKDTPKRGNAGYMSDYVWGFVNRIAGEIEKSHPGRKIGCCAYGAYLLPPEKVDLHKNVIVMICRGRQNDVGNPEGRAQALEIRNAWKAKLAPNSLYTWDYYLTSRSDNKGLPVFFPHAASEDLKSWKGVLQGEFVESWKEKGGLADPGLNHLNAFVTARLYWNPDQDVDKMLNEYYSSFFGPVKDEMKGFYERAEKSWKNYSAADVEYLMKTLADAEKKAGADTVYGKRVALIRGECESKLREVLLQKNSKEEYARIEIKEQPASGITLDGRLDEAAWNACPELALRDCVNGEAAKNPAQFRVTCDSKNLYIGIVCQEPDMKSIKASGTKHDDMNVWLDDAVEIVLKTPKHSYYQFAVNPNGALVDVDRKQGMNGINWDSGAAAVSIKDANSWTLEICIPLKGIEGEKPSADKPWNLNVGRSRPRDTAGEVSIFVPSGKPTFHNMNKMATLVVKEDKGEE